MKISVGILGGTGYVGVELLRLLAVHAKVEVKWVTSEKFSGKKIWEVFPGLYKFLDSECINIAQLSKLDRVDLVFSCLPHGASMRFVGRLIESGARVIDLSADFRLKNPDIYEEWYKAKHIQRELLKEAVFGLPELHREDIKDAKLVANPGCYSTSVILGLAPLAFRKLIKEDSTIVADSKAGMSGGGRAPSLESHYSESNESVVAYRVEGLGQKSEMEEVLSGLAGERVKVAFIPHLVPMNRGILTTIYAALKGEENLDEILGLYKEFYSHSPFIRIYEKESYPGVKNVRYSNFCDIGVGLQEDKFIAIVALDNLGKGASGQAVQNMNIMFSFPENEGLNFPGVFP